MNVIAFPTAPRRRSLAVCIGITLGLHLGVLGTGAYLASREPAPPAPHIARVLVGHVDPAQGDFVAEGYANARLR